MQALRQRAAGGGASGAADAAATAADENEPPHHLRCPITLTLFRDPVVTSAGHSYERSALLAAWRASGHCRDPSTGQAITPALTPNWNLRQQVQAFLDARPADFVPEGWPDRQVPRLKRDGTPRDPNAEVVAAQPPAWGVPARKEWLIWLALAACAAARGLALRSLRAALGWALVGVALRFVAPEAWRAVRERRDALAAHWLYFRFEFQGTLAPATACALMHLCAEAALVLASHLLLPPALLSADGLVSKTVRWVTRASWFRPVLWLQVGFSSFIDDHSPLNDGRYFAGQLFGIAPAMECAYGAWNTLLACIAYVVPPLGKALALTPLCLIAVLLSMFAVSTDEAQHMTTSANTRITFAQILHGRQLADARRTRYIILCCFVAASLLLAPLAAQAAAGACMPMPLRLLRFAFGAEVVAAGPSTALHAAMSAGCGASVLRALTPLPRPMLDGADGRGATPAVLAAQRGDAEALHALAAAGASLTALAASFGTPLHAAAAGDHVAAAEAILQLAPDAVSSRDAAGATPLVSAVRAGAEATATLLLAYGADASPAALALGEAHATHHESLLALALPRPVLLDELVRARCAAIAAAASPAAAAAQLRAELARLQGELKLSAPQLPPEAERVLARLQEGAARCDSREDARP